MPLTVRDVLALDAVRAGQPIVLAAADRLDAPVRWVHAAEISDVGRLLHGGELVLSTGIALPSSASGLAEYIASLAGAGVAGLAIELGQRYARALPPALVTAAEARGIPLVAFQREVPFVEITEAVHARIIDDQMAELRSAQRAHEVFTGLSVDGAPPEEIVAAAAALAGRPVLLADLSYRVLAAAGIAATPPPGPAAPGRVAVFDQARIGGASPWETAAPPATGGHGPGGTGVRGREGGEDEVPPREAAAAPAGSPVVPDDFASRARAACEGRPRTFHAEALPPSGWLVTMVGARGEDWGRLFLACPGDGTVSPGPAAPQPPAPEDTVLLERAATTLALGRLLARQAESVERQAHRTLLNAIIEDADPAAATARARAMGVPVTGRQLIALVARVPDADASGPAPGWSAQAVVVGIAGALADACRDIRVPALVGPLDDVRVGALLSLPGQADADGVLRHLCARLPIADRARPQREGDSSSPAHHAPPAHHALSAPPAPVIGVGSPTTGMAEARRSFLDAREVADMAIRHPDGRPFYRLPDLRLRGLLHLLRGDPRLTGFAERELGPLLAYDAAHDTRLADDLAAYLEAGGNKATAAARAHLARPTFYQRLRLIEHVLGVSLDSPESRTSLHVALLALGPRGEG